MFLLKQELSVEVADINGVQVNLQMRIIKEPKQHKLIAKTLIKPLNHQAF